MLIATPVLCKFSRTRRVIADVSLAPQIKTDTLFFILFVQGTIFFMSICSYSSGVLSCFRANHWKYKSNYNSYALKVEIPYCTRQSQFQADFSYFNILKFTKVFTNFACRHKSTPPRLLK